MPSKKDDKENPINEEIMFDKMLVISETGEQLGVLSRIDALKVAEEHGYEDRKSVV